MSKIMQIFYGNDCLPYKDRDRQVHYPIIGNSFSGASLVDEIRFYVKDISDNDTIWVACAKRADGQTAYKQLEFETDTTINEKYVPLQLSQWFTAKKGDLYIALNGYKGGVDIQVDSDSGLYTISGTPIIQATGSVKLAINYAPIMNNGYGEIPQVTVQEALGLISTKLDKGSPNYIKVIDDIDNLNTSTYEHYVFANDIVLAKDNGSGENELFVVSGLYPSLTLTELSLYVSQLTGQTINASDIVISNSGTFPTTSDILIGSTTLKSLLDAKADLSYVNSAIETIKQEEYVLADYTTYPTLQVWLDNFDGEEGHIYLYPINTNEAPDFTSGFYKYIYETDSGWISLGTTTIDLSDYYTKEDADSKFATITSVQSELALKADKVGALPSFSVGFNDSILTFLTTNNVNREMIAISISNIHCIGTIYSANDSIGFELEEVGSKARYVGTNTNVSKFYEMISATYQLNFEETNNKTTTLSSSSTDTQYPSAKCVWDNLQDIREQAEGKCKTIVISDTMNFATLKEALGYAGKAFLFNSTTKEFDIEITQNVLDGDYDENGVLNAIFDSNNNSVTGNSDDYLIFFNEIIPDVGPKHLVISQENLYDDYLNKGDIVLVTQTLVPDRWYADSESGFYKLETSKIDLANLYAKNASLVPTTTNTYDLGSSSYTFKDLYLSGQANVGSLATDTIKDSNSGTRLTLSTSGYAYFNAHTLPSNNNTRDLGSSSYKWKDIYFAGNLKGGATLTQAQYDALVSGGTVDSDTFYFIEEE